eukprot:11031617-Alexandrium_andersonii.AAC.1
MPPWRGGRARREPGAVCSAGTAPTVPHAAWRHGRPHRRGHRVVAGPGGSGATGQGRRRTVV